MSRRRADLAPPTAVDQALERALAELLTERDVRPRPRVTADDVAALSRPGVVRCAASTVRRTARRT